MESNSFAVKSCQEPDDPACNCRAGVHPRHAQVDGEQYAAPLILSLPYLLTDTLQWTRKCEPNSSSSRAPRPSRVPQATPWPAVASIWQDGWQALRPILRLTPTPRVEELRAEKPVAPPGSVPSFMHDGLVLYCSNFRLDASIEYRTTWNTSRINHITPCRLENASRDKRKPDKTTQRPTSQFSCLVRVKIINPKKEDTSGPSKR